MKTWLKGGITGTISFFLIQLIDTISYAIWNVIPFNSVKYFLYFDFFQLYGSFMTFLGPLTKGTNLSIFFALMYSIVWGFIIGSLVGLLIGKIKSR